MFLLHLFNHQLYALCYIHPLNEIQTSINHFEIECETGSGWGVPYGTILGTNLLLSLAIMRLHRKSG